MRRRPLREGTSGRLLPPELCPARPAVVAAAPARRPTGVLYVVQAVSWWRPRFANHPDGGFPREVFRSLSAAEARRDRLDREYRAENCPLSVPPRGTVVVEGGDGYAEPWAEDEPRLLVLGDYVQDLGLPPPAEPTVEGWRAWWRATRPAMEPWQVEAIWTFLDRGPAFRVSEVACGD